MKTFAFVALFCLVVVPAQAAQNGGAPAPDAGPGQAASSAPAASPTPAGTVAQATPPKIDPAKAADIRQLLDLTGSAALARQVMSNMEQSMRPLMTGALPPGEYREKLVDLFFEKFQSKVDVNNLLDLAIARYDENFSDDEIKQLIAFYQTPLGQKVVTVLPKLATELQQDGQKMGQQLGRESMLEVLQEHPDLAQALQDAARRPASPDQK
jgi:uncharacterized protein